MHVPAFEFPPTDEDKERLKAEWLDMFKDRLSFGDSPYALALCHPWQYMCKVAYEPEGAHKDFLKLLHGVEVKNQGFDFIGIEWLFKYLHPNFKQLRNSDAHTAGCLDRCCNQLDVAIYDEVQLIQWLRSDS
jgi:hypothetical protein